MTKEPPPPNGSLTRLLGQSRHVKGLVEEAAQQLGEVNEVLKDDLIDDPTGPAVERAVEQSTEVELKVKDASEQLAVVNQALHEEVAHRHALEGELAAVAKQSEADHEASLHDPLTGLANRALFDDRLAHGLAQAKRQGWTLAVLFADLNGFKAINDVHGHAAGDAVLRTIGARLTAHARADDTVGRYGGDEFVFLLSGALADEAIEAVARKLVDAIQLPCEFTVEGKTFSQPVGVSIGIALFPRDGDTPEALLTRADKAMYEAKRGKTGFGFAAEP